MELPGLVNGFAINCGGMQAALAEERTRTGVTAEQQAAAQVSQLAAGRGQRPLPEPDRRAGRTSPTRT
jgi:hypothetical protein